jgi:hypothetical protein
MGFVIGLIIFILILRLIPSLILWWVRRKIRKANPMEEPSPEARTSKPTRKKRIGDDKGDYVDFEEVE